MIASVASGCANNTVVDLCAAIDPIWISKDDVLTSATAQQILDHNEFWEAECQ